MRKNSTCLMNQIGLCLTMTLFGLVAHAQKPELKVLKSPDPIICYQKNSPAAYHVDVPESFRMAKENNAGRVKTSNIEVEYINFPADNQAKNAFQFAVEIWESQLASTVPIRRVTGEHGPAPGGVDPGRSQTHRCPLAVGWPVVSSRSHGIPPGVEGR